MTLNIPETRQTVLERRLERGDPIVAADFASEFQVSVDTVRRDIIALEAAGKARRVRGGAMSVARPAGALQHRLNVPSPGVRSIVARTLMRLRDCETLILDGGSTTLALAQSLIARSGLLVITPSPWIAVVCQERGIEVFLLGGRLSASGGVAVGESTLARTADIAADVAILGACGLDPAFGLSSDDFEEAQLKCAMSRAAARTIVVSTHEKLAQRARHRTLPLRDIDVVVTDASGPQVASFAHTGVDLDHV